MGYWEVDSRELNYRNSCVSLIKFGGIGGNAEAYTHRLGVYLRGDGKCIGEE